MKKFFALVAAALVAIAPAFAQVGPGPGPVPNPWKLNGSQVYYNQGCVTVSATAPGACHGVGSLSVDSIWVNGVSGVVSSVSFASTGLTPATPTSGAVVVGGILVPANGGTGLGTVTANGLLYGNGTSTLGVTAAGTNGQYLKGTTGSPPAWATLASDAVTTWSGGTTGLTPSSGTSGAVTLGGTLVVSNGGTGATTLAANGVLYGSGTSAIGATAVGTTGQYFKGNTAAAPSWGTLSSDAVTTVNFGTTGLTPSSATSGAVSVAGTLVVGNGGTGATTLTGMLKGNGTSAFTAGTAGTDYVAPGTATNFTAKQTFTGTSSTIAAALVNASEPAVISATAATGTINYDVCSQSILYYTSNASANWTVNLRCSSGTSLNTAMATGDVITVVFMVTQGGTAYYNNALQVDGGSVTPKYQGGTAWSAGNINGIDIYTYAIVKTGSAAFTVLASQVQFK